MDIQEIIEKQREEFKDKFKCIQSNCDWTWCIPVAHTVARQISDTECVEDIEWEAEQCQFHAEYLIPFFNWHISSIKELLQSEIERKKEQIEAVPNINDKMLNAIAWIEWTKNIINVTNQLNKLRTEDIEYLTNILNKI